ncbi:hypothetical protein CRYUN_Cryun01aG0016200 [Craigia yunnanensis]
MAASSTFESSLRRENPTTTTTSRKTTPSSSSSDSPKRAATAPPRRSRSVSAFSRTSHSDFSEFSIKRDNPLFDDNNNNNSNDEDAFPNSILKSDQITSKTKPKAVAADDYDSRRGRSISRNDPAGKHVWGSGNSRSCLGACPLWILGDVAAPSLALHFQEPISLLLRFCLFLFLL